MGTKLIRGACWFVSSILIAGCGAGGGGNGGGDEPGGQDLGSVDGCGLCGRRTVSRTPEAGLVRLTTTTTIEVDPSNSGLARALGLAQFAALGNQFFEPTVSDFQVDADGFVNGEDTRLLTRCGCLLEVPVGDEGEDNELVPSSDFEPPKSEPGPCPEGQFPLGRNGLTFGEVTGDFVCIRLSSGDVCYDCAQGDDVWTATFEAEAEYEALGSLDGVRIVNFLTGESVEVDIRRGDRVTYWLIAESRVEQITNP